MERPIRYLRGSFLYGRTFLSDADLTDQVAYWLDTVANPRVHGTTGARPAERFRLEEQAVLQPLPGRPYHSLVLGPTAPRPATPLAMPRIVVERRSLQAYAALARAGA